MTDGLSPDSIENLNKVMEMIDGKSAEYKIEKTKLILGVTIIPEEARHNVNILKNIIAVRMLRKCPKCKGQAVDPNNHFKTCDLCKGQAEVTGVEEEKYLLGQT